jgi:hypothetical protein
VPLLHPDRAMVYVAGPYVHPDPVENTNTTIRVAESFEITGVITAIVPHLTLLWHLVAPHDPDHWYDYDLAILKRCDALFRIPGQSTGADNEVAYANDHYIPVFHDSDELIKWAGSFVAGR